MAPTLYRYIIQNSYKSQVIVVVLTLALLPLAPIPLELQRRMLNEAIDGQDLNLLWQLGAMYLGLILLQSGVKFAMKWKREVISARIVHSLRHSIFRCIYTVLPPSKIRKGGGPDDDRVDEGMVVSMLNSEVRNLGEFSGSAISGPVLQVGTIVFVLGYMFWVEPTVALVAVGLYLPQFIIVPLAQRRINILTRRGALKVRQMSGFIVDNAEHELIGEEAPDEFVALTDEILKFNLKAVRLKHIMKTINNLLIALGPLGVIGIGGWMVIEGQIEAGVILAFVSGLERLGGPVRDLIGFYRKLSDANMRYRMLISAFPSEHRIGPLEPAEAQPA